MHTRISYHVYSGFKLQPSVGADRLPNETWLSLSSLLRVTFSKEAAFPPTNFLKRPPATHQTRRAQSGKKDTCDFRTLPGGLRAPASPAPREEPRPPPPRGSPARAPRPRGRRTRPLKVQGRRSGSGTLDRASSRPDGGSQNCGGQQSPPAAPCTSTPARAPPPEPPWQRPQGEPEAKMATPRPFPLARGGEEKKLCERRERNQLECRERLIGGPPGACRPRPGCGGSVTALPSSPPPLLSPPSSSLPV